MTPSDDNSGNDVHQANVMQRYSDIRYATIFKYIRYAWLIANNSETELAVRLITTATLSLLTRSDFDENDDKNDDDDNDDDDNDNASIA